MKLTTIGGKILFKSRSPVKEKTLDLREVVKWLKEIAINVAYLCAEVKALRQTVEARGKEINYSAVCHVPCDARSLQDSGYRKSDGSRKSSDKGTLSKITRLVDRHDISLVLFLF